MKGYIKPKIEVNDFRPDENIADLWSDIFGTGEEIPVSVYTMSDDSSVA